MPVEITRGALLAPRQVAHAVIDCGIGNSRAVCQALRRVGAVVELVENPADMAKADSIILPGIGSFPAFMSRLRVRSLVEPLLAAVRLDKPVLGICVGMQVLASLGSEGGVPTPGLALFEAQVLPLRALGVQHNRVPHVGWNTVHVTPSLRSDSPLHSVAGRDVYFMHSYAVPDTARVRAATTYYESRFCSAVEFGRVTGVQFHPEKSQHAGFDFLDAWVRTCETS